MQDYHTYNQLQIKLIFIRVVALGIIAIPCVLPLTFLNITLLESAILAMFIDVVIPCILGSFLVYGGPYDWLVNYIYSRFI